MLAFVFAKQYTRCYSRLMNNLVCGFPIWQYEKHPPLHRYTTYHTRTLVTIPDRAVGIHADNV